MRHNPRDTRATKAFADEKLNKAFINIHDSVMAIFEAYYTVQENIQAAREALADTAEIIPQPKEVGDLQAMLTAIEQANIAERQPIINILNYMVNIGY